MATANRRKPPLPTVKRILKGHSQRTVSRKVDALVYLDYILFMEELMKNAERKAKEGGDAKGKIQARDLRKVTLGTLRRFKG